MLVAGRRNADKQVPGVVFDQEVAGKIFERVVQVGQGVRREPRLRGHRRRRPIN